MLPKFRLKLLLILLIAIMASAFKNSTSKNGEGNKPLIQKWEQVAYSNYHCLQDTSLNFEAFKQGLHGFYTLKSQGKLSNSDYLTIVDFSQHSSRERLYVIETKNFSVVYKSLCSHGRNTGGAEANEFSNKVGSLQSSYGFFIANETYTGKFDLAMRLDGLEYCNSKARERGIVVHGANYATKSFLDKNNNVLGRSYGCPALPMDEAPKIIHTIKEGSCFFIYSPDKSYPRKSTILRSYDFMREL